MGFRQESWVGCHATPLQGIFPTGARTQVSFRVSCIGRRALYNSATWKATCGLLIPKAFSHSSTQNLGGGLVLILTCPTLCPIMDCKPLASSAYGISQARILEQGLVPFLAAGIFPAQGLNLCLLYSRQVLFSLSDQEAQCKT